MRLPLAMLLAACALLGTHAVAQERYPTKPMRLIIPFPPGGSNDIVGRIVAQRLAVQMDMQVIVDNRGGASGNIAHEIVARAVPDGYTILLNSSGIVLTPALSGKVQYDVVKDYTPVVLLTSVPLVLLVNPAVPVNTIKDFVAYGKANPGKMSYGSAGTGNITHLGALMFLQAAGVNAVHIPYKGSGPALVDAIAGHTQFVMVTVATAASVLQDKRLKVLAISSLKRSPLIPDVPTLSETVMPKFEIGTWQGLMLPAKAPPAVVKKLNAEAVKALQDKEVLSRLTAAGAEPIGSTPEEYAAYIRSELARWTALGKSAGIKLE